jgi:hypothetical protein
MSRCRPLVVTIAIKYVNVVGDDHSVRVDCVVGIELVSEDAVENVENSGRHCGKRRCKGGKMMCKRGYTYECKREQTTGRNILTSSSRGCFC